MLLMKEILAAKFLSICGAFDTVDYQILLAKSDHYGICGVSND